MGQAHDLALFGGLTGGLGKPGLAGRTSQVLSPFSQVWASRNAFDLPVAHNHGGSPWGGVSNTNGQSEEMTQALQALPRPGNGQAYLHSLIQA